MPRIIQNTVFVCLFAAIAILSSTRPAYACSTSRQPPTLEETVAAADVIVVAEVVDTYITPWAYATLHVEKYLKGSGPDILVSAGYGYGGGDCRNRVVSGLQGIFYLDGDSNSHETLSASYAYPYSAVSDLDLESIKQIVQITGQETLPNPSSFETRVHAFGKSFPWLLLSIVFLVLLLIVALCFLVVFSKVVLFFVRRINGTSRIKRESTS
jgi:hypothetical protein